MLSLTTHRLTLYVIARVTPCCLKSPQFSPQHTTPLPEIRPLDGHKHNGRQSDERNCSPYPLPPPLKELGAYNGHSTESRPHHRGERRPGSADSQGVRARFQSSTSTAIPYSSTAERRLKRGNQVINYANNGERASALVAELSAIPSTHPHASSPRFHAVRADVGVKASVCGLVREAHATMGRIDVVISNAGWTRVTDFADFAQGLVDDDWDRCFLYNVKTHLWLMEAALPHLRDTRGAFVSTASLAGVKPSGSSLPYAVTKAAQIHLAKSLAVILGGEGIRCNSVAPGLMETEWGLKFPEELRERIKKGTKLGRLATVEDVAEQVRCLALSQSTTGQNVVIDSGTGL